jgi:hypothetical protein
MAYLIVATLALLFTTVTAGPSVYIPDEWKQVQVLVLVLPWSSLWCMLAIPCWD